MMYDSKIMRKLCLLTLFNMSLIGCGELTTLKARDQWGALIGMGLPDLLSCAGIPDHVQKTGPDTLIAQWDQKDATSGFKITTPLLGSIELGAGASCSMVATVLRDGTVVTVNFPRAQTTLGGGPYSGCSILVRECLDYSANTGLPKNYDAMQVLMLTPTPLKPASKPTS